MSDNDIRLFVRDIIRYINHRLDRPERLILGGTSGSGGGYGGPPAGVIGKLPQSYVCYDTDELTTAGSSPAPSLLHNLNRIRGGHAIGDDAIIERHMAWSPDDTFSSSGCIDASHIPFFNDATAIPDDNVRDTIEWVYTHRADDLTSNFYVTQQFIFTVEGEIEAVTGNIEIWIPCTLTISEVRARVSVAPVGQDIIIDINKNGTSVLDVDKLVIEDGAYYGTATPDTTALADGDILTMDVDQRGSSTPGSYLVVSIICIQYLQGA